MNKHGLGDPSYTWPFSPIPLPGMITACRPLVRNHGILQILTAACALLVESDKAIAPAILTRVATAWIETISHRRNRRLLGRVNAIATVAFLRVFQTGNCISSGFAIRNAPFDRHVGA
jgi:hypothetical protein